MPNLQILIGAPSILVYKITGKEDNEDFMVANFREITPSTGPILLEEAWSKQEVTIVTLKIKSLDGNFLKLCSGDLLSVKVIMPLDCEGNQEIKYTKFARVEKIAHVLPTKQTTEYYEYEIIFAKDSFRNYDHDCICDHKFYGDCQAGGDLFVREMKDEYYALKARTNA